MNAVKVKVVEFIHTSWMTDAEKETFHLQNGKWKNVNFQSRWANVTFEENLIPKIEWWS